MENKKIKIKEIIVVEGRDDITAVKRVVDGHVVALNGFSGMSIRMIKKLTELSKENDLVLLTDPDFAGKRIREKIKKSIPHIKHAFISRKDALKNKNIGVENASDEAILEALSHIISEKDEKVDIFIIKDLLDNRLCNGKNAKNRRAMLGDILKIGYYNSKQLLRALNSFNISRKEFNRGINEINKNEIL